MANNPNVNKVELADGSTLIDLTSDTATASDVVRGETFHLASGAPATGTMDVAGAITDAQVDSVLADSAPTGTDSLRLSQLTRFWNGLKTKFAALVHYHTTLGNSSTTCLTVDPLYRSVAANNGAAGATNAHAEGAAYATGHQAHAEGYQTTASGFDAHSEGRLSTASGDQSHAQGYGTKASSAYQHAAGKYNVEDTQSTYAEIVGNGASSSARSNARTLDWDGNAWHAGEVSATEHVSGGTDVTHNLTEKADQADVDTALAGKAATVHNHSGQAITPASVTASGAIQGSSISDGTGTLAQLRESVSHRQVSVTYTASSKIAVRQCSCYRAGDVVMFFVQFYKQAATDNQEVLVTFSNLPAPVMATATFATNQTDGTTVTITTDGKMISGGASSLVKDWLNAVFVYVTAS